MEPDSPSVRQVFLSYAHADKNVARRLGKALRDAGVRVSLDEWDIRPGDSIADRVRTVVAANDLLLVLISRNSVDAPWLTSELAASLGRELGDRAVTVVPTLIDDSRLPEGLAAFGFLDLRHFDEGVNRFVQQIGAIPDIDYARLDPRRFEHLVADLLVELGFSVEFIAGRHDSGVDMIASYPARDPFGAREQQLWLVEAKHYRDDRVGISSLRQMSGFLALQAPGSRGLIVTNGQLTSVSRRFLHETKQRSGLDLRVVAGTELTRLLIQHPQLVLRYFAAGARDE